MDRLTFEGNFCDIAQCRELPCPNNGACSQRKVWERLKQYEDTGYTPEEIEKLQGTRENMDMVAMVLMDKCGWHVFEETSDIRDTHSIAYLYECLEKLAEEINEGRIKRKHIKDVLKDECGVVFGD